MKKTTKLVLMSVLTIALCVSLIAGATFALFTDGDSVNIAVNSGKVEIVAKVTSVDTYSYDDPDEDGTFTQEPMPEDKFIYGTAEIDSDGNLELNNMVPGDKAVVTIELTNKSSVDIQYRTLVSVAEDKGLFDGLEITIGESKYTGGFTAASIWAPFDVEDPIELTVEIELPYLAEDQNMYQDKGCTITYAVEAVQGNAHVENITSGSHAIFNLSDLTAMANMTAAGDTAGKNFELGGDLDLSGKKMQPIGNSNAPFEGIFDGHGNTISNFEIVDADDSYSGLFGTLSGATVKNVTIENVSYNGTKKAGALAGRVTRSDSDGKTTIENVIVESGEIITDDAAGGLVGYIRHEPREFPTGDETTVEIKNCESNVNITAVEKAGGIAAHIEGENVVFSGCVNRGDLTVSGSKASAVESNAGGIVGYVMKANKTVFTNCTNYGNITATQEENGKKLDVGGIICSAHEGEFVFTDVANYGAITAYDNTTTKGAQTKVGGIVGSSSRAIEMTNAVSKGNITVYTGNVTNANVGGILGRQDSKTLSLNLNGAQIECDIVVDQRYDMSSYAGIIVGFATKDADIYVDNVEAIVSIDPYKEVTYGMEGGSDSAQHEMIITNSFITVNGNSYVWDENGNVSVG